MNGASSVLCLVLLGAELCAAVLAMPKLSGDAWAVTCLYPTVMKLTMVMLLLMTIMMVGDLMMTTTMIMIRVTMMMMMMVLVVVMLMN